LPAGPDLDALAERLGYRFKDPSLLRQSLAHRSWCAEFPGNASNERLEFLGDAVLGWVVADLVYRTHVSLAEGQLTDLRKAVVNAGALAQAAMQIDLGQQLLLGKGEDAAGGRAKPSILSDAFEAVIGAVYLDGGSQAAYDLVTRLVGPQLVDAGARIGGFDHKTALQELAARLLVNPPMYVVTEDGPDHAKRFHAMVRVDGRVLGEGEGRSKKQAEQAAAQMAREVLEGEQPVAHA
jgi:ribonuclease-3